MRKKWKSACDQLSYRAYSESRAYALTVRFKSTFLCLGHMRRVPAKVAHLGPQAASLFCRRRPPWSLALRQRSEGNRRFFIHSLLTIVGSVRLRTVMRAT